MLIISHIHFVTFFKIGDCGPKKDINNYNRSRWLLFFLEIFANYLSSFSEI